MTSVPNPGTARFRPIDAHRWGDDPEVASITSSRPGAFFYYVSDDRVTCFRDAPNRSDDLVTAFHDAPYYGAAADTYTYHQGHRLWYGPVDRVHEWI